MKYFIIGCVFLSLTFVYTAQAINLKMANIRIDIVMKAVGLSEGYQVVMIEPLDGKVSINLKNVHWQEVFDEIAELYLLEYRIEHNIIYVQKRK